ncbi:hypothetical protein ACGFZJ_11125 [Streptomyces sp. NPDC048253]|uniref:hypothetical protein n=1 Tax=Streptomyces sp. NPDC048253 TaxID=3365524 RepID=UPI00371A5C6D
MATTFPAAVMAAQTGPGRAEVLDQVARLVDLKESAIEQMRAEALGAPTRGVVAYGEYQSGGWWTAALMNHSDSGDPHDVVIGDGRPQPTLRSGRGGCPLISWIGTFGLGFGLCEALPEATRHARKFCTTRCRARAQVLRNRGLMPGRPTPPDPGPRPPRPDLPGDASVMSLTSRLPW